LNAARIGPRIEHDIDNVVFHGRIQVLFNDRAEAVNFVDEQNISFAEVGEQTCEVSGFVEYWA